MSKPINKRFKRTLLAASLMSVSGHLFSYESPYELPNELPPEAEEGFLEPNWFDGKDHTVAGLRLSLRNFRHYYSDADALYGYGMPSLQERSTTLAQFMNFALDNVIGNKTNGPPLNGGGWTIATPVIPLVNRVVTPINESAGFRKPVLPPMRWTRDGRVGILGSVTGVDAVPEPLTFHLNRPEVLKNNLLDNAPGITSLNPLSFKTPYSKWGIPGAKTAHGIAICDPAPTKNPYTCGTNNQDDCYDVTLVGSAVKHSYITSGRLVLDENKDKLGHSMAQVLPMLEKEEKIFSRKMTIRVSNPKTSAAKIEDVSFSSVYQTAPIQQGVLFEMNLPADGRLVVARRSGIPLVWRHTTTGKTHFGAYETVYAAAPNNKPACDASTFGELRPISHAPFDPLVKNKYPFAKYQFRDPMGNYVPDGEDIKGTYPWLDMDAKNMSLTIGDAELYNGAKKTEPSKHRYKSECLYPEYCDPNSPLVAEKDKRAAAFADKGLLSQFALMGSWTKGKMVVLDSMVNYSDFRTALKNAVNVSLYEPNSALSATVNKSHKVEVGASRDLAFGSRRDSYITLKDENGQEISSPRYMLKNTTFFDSIENRLNFNPHMRPAMPKDVVWTLSSGATSDEFSFDDLLNNNAFIVSDMVAAYSRVENHSISPFRMVAFDGWKALSNAFTGQVKVQNAATTLPATWVVPHSGDVVHGRIEPVANGGVKGKGLYFNGSNTRILYNISSYQPQNMNNSTWFHSLFIDARELSTTVERVLIDFPDKSRLTLLDAGINVNLKAYNKHGELQKTIAVPSYLVKAKWFNFGVQKTPNGLITFFVNGYPYSEFTASSLFQMTGGDLVLGRAHNSYDLRYANYWDQISNKPTATPANYGVFKGWMDDYKVFAYQPDLETACNLAHGTLVAPNTNTTMQTLAKLYPQAMHDKVSYELKMRGQWSTANYACYTGDPSQDKTAVLHSLPSGSIPVRTAMHFPEGPLYHDAPRPDSTTNEFCLACHSDGDKVVGLQKTSVLAYKSGLMAKADPRRQPTQPLPSINGNLPVDFLKSIRLGNTSTSSYIDEHMMPSSAGVVPGVWNLTLLNIEGKPVGVMPSVLTKGSFSGLRLNTSGLTSQVQFQTVVNGSIKSSTDATAPFEVSASFLEGATTLKVIAYGSNGIQSPWKYYNYTLK